MAPKAAHSSHFIWLSGDTQTLQISVSKALRITEPKQALLWLAYQNHIQQTQCSQTVSMIRDIRQHAGVVRIDPSMSTMAAWVHCGVDNLDKVGQRLHQWFEENNYIKDWYPTMVEGLVCNLKKAQNSAEYWAQWLNAFSSVCENMHWQKPSQAIELAQSINLTDVETFLQIFIHTPNQWVIQGGNEHAVQNIAAQWTTDKTQSTAPTTIKTPSWQRTFVQQDASSISIAFEPVFKNVEEHIYAYFLFEHLSLQLKQSDDLALQDISCTSLCVHSHQSRFTFFKGVTPEHYSRFTETFWQWLETQKQKIISKENIAQALLVQKTKWVAQTTDAWSLHLSALNHQSPHTVYAMGQSILHQQDIHTRQWARLFHQVFDFERQKILEVAPKTTGSGANENLRLKSLKKRLEHVFADASGQLLADHFQYMPVMSADQQPDSQAEVAWLSPKDGWVQHTLPAQKQQMLSVCFKGGRCQESSQTAGSTQLLLRCVLEGSQGQKEKTRALEKLGVQISEENTADFFGFHFQFFPSVAVQVLPLIHALIFEATWGPLNVAQQKIHVMTQQQARQQDPAMRSIELFHQALFGAHGYGQFRYGTAQTIVPQTLDNMISLYEQTLLKAPQRLWTYTGPDLNPSLKEWVAQKVQGDSGTEKKANAAVRSLFTQKQLRIIEEPAAHGFYSLAMGFESLPMQHADAQLLNVVQMYLSGLGGVLYDTLRTKLDAVSHVKAYHVSLAQKGSFFIQLVTKNKVDEELYDYLQTLFLTLKQRAPKENLFEQAKQMQIQAVNQALHDPYELSYDIASRFFGQLPLEDLWNRTERIGQLSPSDVVEATQEIIQPNRFAMGTC